MLHTGWRLFLTFQASYEVAISTSGWTISNQQFNKFALFWVRRSQVILCIHETIHVQVCPRKYYRQTFSVGASLLSFPYAYSHLLQFCCKPSRTIICVWIFFCGFQAHPIQFFYFVNFLYGSVTSVTDCLIVSFKVCEYSYIQRLCCVL